MSTSPFLLLVASSKQDITNKKKKRKRRSKRRRSKKKRKRRSKRRRSKKERKKRRNQKHQSKYNEEDDGGCIVQRDDRPKKSDWVDPEGNVWRFVGYLKVNYVRGITPGYACPYCGKKEKSEQRTAHYKQCRGVKDYVCVECGWKFTKKCNYKMHLRIHSGNTQPFECKGCEMRFSRKYSLKRHLINSTISCSIENHRDIFPFP